MTSSQQSFQIPLSLISPVSTVSQPSQVSPVSQPSQEDLIKAYQKDLKHKEQNRKNQKKFQDDRKNKISSYESEIIQLKATISKIEPYVPLVVWLSQSDPQLFKQLDDSFKEYIIQQPQQYQELQLFIQQQLQSNPSNQ